MSEDAVGGWISVPEAARLKGVAASAVRAAIRTGRLDGGKVGRSYIVRLGDVEGWQPEPRDPKRRRLGQSPSLAGSEPGDPTTLRQAVLSFLVTGGGDEAARQRILELPGGAEALARLARIEQAQRRFAGLGPSTELYLRCKQEEIEEEQRRDAARDA
jgi:hypothetical protein